jgi:gas vesicle protein
MSDIDERDVVYVEREGGSIKPLLVGMLLGVGLGLLFAPQTGEQTRRALNRRLRKFRALAEEKVDELSERFSGQNRTVRPPEEPEPRPTRESVRDDLERRLAQARARRRAAAEDEEQHA